MTIGDLRKVLNDLNLPDNTILHHLHHGDHKTKIKNWFIHKSPNGDDYELIFISIEDNYKSTKPPPFNQY